jgi:hypothetical protein
LILPRAAPRSSVTIQNTSASDTIVIEIGCARATATISGGKVTAVTVTNGGFGFTYPPYVKFLGGGNQLNGRDLGLGYPGQYAPSNVATAHCVLTAGAVSSIVIDNPGSGYDICTLRSTVERSERQTMDVRHHRQPAGINWLPVPFMNGLTMLYRQMRLPFMDPPPVTLGSARIQPN